MARNRIAILLALVLSLSASGQERESAAALFQGLASGVLTGPVTGNAGEDPFVLIRGGNGFRTQAAPLWIVDGIEVNPYYSYLNIRDITDVKILKDLTATSEYGSRGANGVILVTTGDNSVDDAFRIGWKSEAGANVPLISVPGMSAGFNHNEYLSLRGSGNNSSYFVSGWFRRIGGVEKRNTGNSGGLRAAFETRANEFLWFGMNSAFMMGSLNRISCCPDFGSPSLTLLQRNPSFYTTETVEGWASDYDDETVDKRLTNSLYLLFNFSPFLKLKIDMGMDMDNSNRFIWYGKGTSVGAAKNGFCRVIGNTDFSYNGQARLSWNRYLAGKHHVNADLAIDTRGINTKRNTMDGEDFFSHKLRARGLNLSNGDPDIRKFDYEYYSHGGFFRAGYAFNDMAGVSGTLRADWTPRYDDQPRLFKSADAWLDLKKAFLKEAGAVSALRLRAGYGEAGKENMVPYGLFGNYLTGDYGSIKDESQMFHEGLWRLDSKEISAGVETGFLKDRITLSAAWFEKSSADDFLAYTFGVKDGYYWVPAPRSDDFHRSGITYASGFEIDASVAVVNKEKFSLTLSADLARNLRRVVEIDDIDMRGYSLGGDFIPTVNAFYQQPAAFYGFKTDDSGQGIDITGDGKVNTYDKVILGNPIPGFYGGAGASLKAGSFSAEILITWASGYDILNLNRMFFENNPPYQVTDRYVEKGDYLRLSSLRAAYPIPLKDRRTIRDLEVSLTARDLLTVTSYSGWNPAILGTDYGTCPPFASVMLGLSIGF